MYCKKCNNLIEDDNLICPKCNFNNEEYLEATKQLDLNKVVEKPQKIQNKTPVTVVMLIILLFIGIIAIYIFKDTKATTSIEKQPITTINIKENAKKFKFKKIILYYPQEFGTSTNTIFYKNNNQYNIVIKNIDETEYNDIKNGNDVLESKLGDIDTLTVAYDDSYSHIFNINNDFYEIKVNYVPTNIDENIQLELSQIINTLQIRK